MVSKSAVQLLMVSAPLTLLLDPRRTGWSVWWPTLNIVIIVLYFSRYTTSRNKSYNKSYYTPNCRGSHIFPPVYYLSLGVRRAVQLNLLGPRQQDRNSRYAWLSQPSGACALVVKLLGLKFEKRTSLLAGSMLRSICFLVNF